MKEDKWLTVATAVIAVSVMLFILAFLTVALIWFAKAVL